MCGLISRELVATYQNLTYFFLSIKNMLNLLSPLHYLVKSKSLPNQQVLIKKKILQALFIQKYEPNWWIYFFSLFSA